MKTNNTAILRNEAAAMTTATKIITLTIEQAKRIAQLSRSCRDDMTRISMTFVRVSPALGFAEACNGYTMARLVLDAELREACGDTEFFLDMDFCKKVLKVKSREASARVEIDFESNKSRLLSDGAITEMLLGDIAKSYPPTDSIIPKHGDDSVTLTLNPELLIDVLESLREHQRSFGVSITFNPKSPTSAMLVKVTKDDSFAVVMPMRSL